MKHKIKIWIKRYLPAEIFGTLFAIICPTVASLVSSNVLIIAFAGAWGENIGFYGTMMAQEVASTRRKHGELNKKYGFMAFGKNIRNIFLEFGAAETIDSLLIRPTTMYFGLALFSNLQFGILTGKMMADFIFYIPTIISYELRKKHLID